MSKANSVRRAQSQKPARPAGSPLFWHASGRWAKKIRGKFEYFGRGSHDDALAEYEQVKADLHAGRRPPDELNGLTVYELTAMFLIAKLAQRDNGELAPLTFAEYGNSCRRMVKVFGRNRLVSDLRPDDFARLRARMAKTWGPTRLAVEIQRARVLFNWAFKNKKIPQRVEFGDGFHKPSKKTLRAHKAALGPRMFEAAEIRSMIDAAGQPLRAMILLGINAGFSNSDIGHLPIKALDLDGGWLNFARVKTAIARKIPLWPKTVETIREWLGMRPEPVNSEHAGFVFITREGRPWIATVNDRALSHQMRRLLDRLGVGGKRSYYHLRHTLQTIGDECGDFLAVRSIMGHATNDISDVYRERISDERLRKVTNYVQAWLFTNADQVGERPQLRIVG